MAILEFDYYMHDNNETDTRCAEISAETGIEIDPDSQLAQLIGRPFYEVVLSCTLDTETGAVQILGARKS